jgi:predicted RNA-binding protein with TRAM domain
VAGTAVASQTYPSAATTQVFGGLTNGTAYQFSVAATNARGVGPTSGLGNATAVGSPSAPLAPTAAPGNARVTLQWTAPANNGAAISRYTVTPYIGGVAQTPAVFNSAATTATVVGLANGTTYQFSVAATNARGLGPASDLGNATTVGIPSAPVTPTAVPGNGRATVRWTASADNGAVISSYTIRPSIGNTAQAPAVFNSAATTATVVGLTNGTTYTFTVTATNARGTGPDSVATAPIVVGAPLAPTAAKAVPGTANATSGPLTVSYLAAANNGAAITKYTATCTSPGGVTKTGIHSGATAAPITVAAVATGKTYTCSVKATNARGAGPASSASLPVIVGSPAPPTNAVAKSGSTTSATGSLTVTFAIGANNGSVITSQTATCVSSNGGVTKSGVHTGATAAPITVAAVTTGKTYTCSVKATNARGVGVASVPSIPVIVGSPAPPTGVSAVNVASGQIRVTFTPGANNGSATTSYTATCTSNNGGVLGSKSGAASPLTVTSLSAGKSYTCKVKGTNARGAGLASASSGAVTA